MTQSHSYIEAWYGVQERRDFIGPLYYEITCQSQKVQ